MKRLSDNSDDSKTTILELKRRLPLPKLMNRLGFGDRAKKSARCPFHDDAKESFSIYNQGEHWGWKCFAGCGGGDEIDFLAKAKGLNVEDAIRCLRDLAGVGGSPNSGYSPPNSSNRDLWSACGVELTDSRLEDLATWRRYSPEFCRWLKQRALIGWHKGGFAFPVHDNKGYTTGIHHRVEDGSWRYDPPGTRTQPLIIGNLAGAGLVFVFESPWDAFATMDKLEFHMEEKEVAVVATRGASNGKMLERLTSSDQSVVAFSQNDDAGSKWLLDVARYSEAPVKMARIPGPYKDLNDWTRDGAGKPEINKLVREATLVPKESKISPNSSIPLIEFCKPSDLQNYLPPEGMVIVGDCHIVQGSVFVIAGAPGIGKSRAMVALAVAGATRQDWFGLPIHRRFRMLIIQAENGRFRLKTEFADLDCQALEDWVRVSPPPPYGFCFDRSEFREQLAVTVSEFKPDIIALDPWNRLARDEKAKDYLAAFELLRAVFPAGDGSPAIGIVAHTRKRRGEERASGRDLLSELAGSYSLGSVPRTVFVMQAATDDPEDSRVVWTCCKNNDGELGARSAWERRNGLFVRVTGFEWERFDNPSGDERQKITESDMAELFQNGGRSLPRAQAAKELEELTQAKRSACYNALKVDGRFAVHLTDENGILKWKD